jgi:hypothetical protein
VNTSSVANVYLIATTGALPSSHFGLMRMNAWRRHSATSLLS